ncbi:MAG: biotin carboxylase N-terminal domain-containing protein [Myxococcota bacterium]
MNIRRVLIANRGEIAKRLIDYYRGQGIETVVAFSEADAEQPYLDDADFAVYLNGRRVGETYLDPHRVVSAALDSGCDAIHPGYCFLAEHVGFYSLATNANIAIYGCDALIIAKVVDRALVRRMAKTLGIPLIPGTEPIPADDDGLAAGAQLGFPLFVKAVAGGALARVDAMDELESAVSDVRQLGRAVSGDSAVFLERAVDDQRHIGVTVVGDRQGRVVHLGAMDGSLEVRYRTWVEELGPDVVSDVSAKLTAASVELAKALGWTGVGKVRWAVTPRGGWYLLGFSARLATGYSLTERVHGVDLLRTQAMALEGDSIPWTQADAKLTEHGIQVRVFHVRTSDLSRPDGAVTRLVLPEGVFVEVGVEEGLECNEDSEPLLVKLTAVAPTRQAALVKMRAALDDLVVEGVDTNLPMLLALFDDQAFWRGEYDVRTLEPLRGN